MKSKKSKKKRKIKLNLFQEVQLKKKNAELAVFLLLCAGVFGAAFFAGGRIMADGHNDNKVQAFQSQIVQVSEIQKREDVASAEENIPPEEEKISEAMSDAADADAAKESAEKAAVARKIARRRASANTARILSGPIPTGRTHGLPDGRRECATKSLHPQRGGKIHVDEDCCADYNEYPNPRCYYTPKETGILKKR